MATFNGLNDNPTYTEGGGRVFLDDDATVTGVANYQGTTLTLARSGGASPDDVFDGSGTLFSEGQVFLTETDPDTGSIDVPVGTYTQSDGTLTITFGANATGTRVNTVLQNITYANGNDTPPDSVTIAYTFNDGTSPATGSITVAITDGNDAPDLEAIVPAILYRPGDPAIVLSPSAELSDTDSTDLVGAEVRIWDYQTVKDGGHVLAAETGGTGISSFFNATTGILTLQGAESLAAYQQVLRTVTYRSTSDDPDQDRTVPAIVIEWEVDDGAGANNLSLLESTTVSFSSTLDLDAGTPGDDYATGYTENGTAVPVVDTDIVLTDNRGMGFASASVVLTNAKAGDSLSIAGSLPGGFTASMNTSAPGQIVLTVTGFDPSGDAYEGILRQVRFGSSSESPDPAPRLLSVSVHDSIDPTNVAQTTIAVTTVNDAPVLANADVTLAGTNEDTPSAGTLVSQLLALAGGTDPDAGALAGAAVTGTSGSGTWQYSTDGVAWTGIGGTSEGAALLLSGATLVRYVPNGVDGENASLTFRAWDQTLGTASANASPRHASTAPQGGTGAFSVVATTGSLAVAAVNDPPVLVQSLADQMADEDRAVGFALPVGAFLDADPGVVLTYSATLANGAPLPAWLAFDPATRSFTGTPGDGDVGAYAIKVTASDGTASASGTFALTVKDDHIFTAESAFSLVPHPTVEELTYTGSGAFTGTGNALANTITGGEGSDVLTGLEGDDRLIGGGGNDTLLGGPGRDRMEGGRGDDTFAVDNRGDEAVEAGHEGTDTILASLTWTLGGTFENLVLTAEAGAAEGSGNALGNTLAGNADRNVLRGLGGDDDIVGHGGDDVIVGGEGKDRLVGGAGADSFAFDAAGESGRGAERDWIEDFEGGTDLVDLRGIDADETKAGNQRFRWVDEDGEGSFEGMSRQLRLKDDVLKGDTDGDGRADFAIRITGSFAIGDVLL